MEPNRSIPAAGVVPVLVYPDVREAVAWLTVAFGFRERLKIGEAHRSQMVAGEGAVIVVDVRHDQVPPSGGTITHYVMVRVPDVDAVYRRAIGHGARVLMELTDFEYGERQCRVGDPAGHQWTFTQTLRDVHPAEWGGGAHRSLNRM